MTARLVDGAAWLRGAWQTARSELDAIRDCAGSLTDLRVASFLLGLIVLGGVAYAVRIATRGTLHYARVDAAGSSPLLGKPAMQMGYWMLSPLGRCLARLSVPPNAITATSLALGACAGVSMAAGHFGIAGGLSAASALGDALDGMVARETKHTSRGGALFDAATDRYNEFFFLAGIGLFYHSSKLLLGLVFLAILGSFLVSYSSAKADAFGVDAPRGAMRRAERATYLTAGAALVPLVAWVATKTALHVPADISLIVAIAVVGVVANASAVARLVRIAALVETRDAERAAAAGVAATPRRIWLRQDGSTLVRHQLASVVTTAVDFGTMALFVERASFNPALATLVGASVGAVLNFALNRRWTFANGLGVTDPAILGQAARYSVVSGASAVLNAVGEQIGAGLLGVPYVIARTGVAALVSIAWNYPMQRSFVFASRSS